MDLFDRFVERNLEKNANPFFQDKGSRKTTKTTKAAVPKSTAKSVPVAETKERGLGALAEEGKTLWKKLPTSGKAGVIGVGALGALGVGKLVFGGDD